MHKTKIAILFGGPSREHDVSKSTGKSMLENIDLNKYDVTKVFITKTRLWIINDGKNGLSAGDACRKLKESKAQIVLLGLHGSFGEDGTVQALLDRYKLPYTGSGTAASLLAMDKVSSNELFIDNNLLVPRTVVYTKDMIASAIKDINDKFTLPVVIKPARQGSSVGVHLAKSETQFKEGMEEAFTHDQHVLVQEYIEGREVACGVLEVDDDFRVLPPTEITPLSANFFDYDAKYKTGGSKEITPPDMPPEIIRNIQQIAVQAHKILGCFGYSRTDMIVGNKGIYVLETNTLPGMTPTSILPQQASKAGLSFQDLLDAIITRTLKTKHLPLTV